MADSEKLTALKKAYAEIILNTAKEAAARIMASEQKAERYRRELVEAKDEALRMLLRLKHLLDSKENEAEMKAGIQCKRIELLEAQLGEAEDIVKDLRSDLRELQDRLENPTDRERVFPSTRTAEGETTSEIQEVHQDSFVCDVSSHQIDNKSNESSEMNVVLEVLPEKDPSYNEQQSEKDESFLCGPDFSSILAARKEPESYRNGCTHRVRASETSVYDESQFPFCRDTQKKSHVISGDHKFGMISSADLRDSKKSAQDLKLMELHEEKGRSCRRKHKISSAVSKLCSETTEAFSDHLPEVSEESEPKPLQNSSCFNSKAAKSLSCSTDNVFISDDSEFFKPSARPCISRKENLEDANDLTGWSMVSSMNSDPVNDQSDVGISNILLEDPTTKESDMTENFCRSSSDRILKYTFHRKRKRELLGSLDEDSSIENSCLKEYINGEQGELVQNPGFTTESSSELGRMERVSCQLVSLSKDIAL